GYYDRWRYDWRLYQPIVHFARDRNIPIIALNISSEIVKRVSKVGWDGLTAVELAQVPQSVDRTNKNYEERLREIFRQHPKSTAVDNPHTGDAGAKKTMQNAVGMHGVDKQPNPHGADSQAGREAAAFERFVDVQLLWDESMAERAAGYVAEHPERTLVVLAGSGHLAHGDGIPDRVRRRISVDTAIILPIHSVADDIESVPADADNIADFLLVSGNRALPPPGMLGVMLGTDAEGVRVASLAPRSAAGAVGVKEGDRMVRIDGRAIETMADIKLALWDKRPGDRVSVDIYRADRLADESTSGQEMRFEVELR
ncbi:MAG: PDZ domain-containing protein, partial [Gammaproteobacteria bacterium]|nr:PDZ domain-containing protein [Gammaproteobacteria bacterium]